MISVFFLLIKNDSQLNANYRRTFPADSHPFFKLVVKPLVSDLKALALCHALLHLVFEYYVIIRLKQHNA